MPPRGYRHATTAGEGLKDRFAVLKDIESFCEDFKSCGCITEDIAILLSANDDMVYDLKVTILPGNRAMNRFRPYADDIEAAVLILSWLGV